MMSLLFTTPLTVRFRDLDAMGHVNNAIFFTSLEEGRKPFFLKSCQSPLSLSFLLFWRIAVVTISNRLLWILPYYCSYG